MPKVGDKEFAYTPEGVAEARRESAATGIPVSDGAKRSVTEYAGGGKVGYDSIGGYKEGGKVKFKGKPTTTKEMLSEENLKFLKYQEKELKKDKSKTPAKKHAERIKDEKFARRDDKLGKEASKKGEWPSKEYKKELDKLKDKEVDIPEVDLSGIELKLDNLSNSIKAFEERLSKLEKSKPGGRF